MVEPLAELMGDAYPELRERRSQIEATLRDEEERFSRTLDAGMGILQQVMAEATGEIDGGTAFLLYDTYGFPLDLTQDIARENGLGGVRPGNVTAAGKGTVIQSVRPAVSGFGRHYCASATD